MVCGAAPPNPSCHRRLWVFAKATLILVAIAVQGQPADWTDPVEVQHEFKRCVSYRARLDGDLLVVRATVGPGWHTFAMDNKQRAEEKLAGKQSLGIDAPTEIKLSHGLEVAGPWRQSPPKDFSQPELRLFTWGFDEQALFVVKIRRSGAGPARIAIQGQACTETICKRVDVAISLPLPGANTNGHPSGIDLQTLVVVR